MHLDYLLFDTTDDETGACSFDAMASALPARLPELLQEIEAVLGWAQREFGPPAATDDAGEWGFELQAADEADQPLDMTYDLERQQVALARPVTGRVTVTLTLSGSRAFGDAWREAFPAD